MTARVLIVDDDAEMCALVAEVLGEKGYSVSAAPDAERAAELMHSVELDVVITDLDLAGPDGLDVCRVISATQPEIPVVVLTSRTNIESAVDAIRGSVYDFITKPVDRKMLLLAVERAAKYRELHREVRILKTSLQAVETPGELVGQSALMQKLYVLVQRVRDTPVSVLITGESGTGKELVARALHLGTSRSDRPFVAVNCAAVPSSLLESELFGHVRGAFTDARAARQGLFQQAEGGTLFLDEIGETPPDMQAKLLRVLQERVVRPVGSNVDVPVEVRVLAATNRDLEQDVERGRFREDLFYRLNVVQVHVPPLRARGNDVLLLANHFTSMASLKLGREVQGISTEAARLLLDYDWPGNVRQLQNCIERAVTLTRSDHIDATDLPDNVRKFSPSPVLGLEPDVDQVLSLEMMEQRYIERVLQVCGDNKSQAARLLGLDRRTLYRKLERHARLAGERIAEQLRLDSEAPPSGSPASSPPGATRSVPDPQS